MKQQIETDNSIKDSSAESGQSVREAAHHLAVKLFPHGRKKRGLFTNALIEMYDSARGKDVLVVHSPGGWGNARWDDLSDWEKSIVTGVTVTVEKLGYDCVMKQYFRSVDALWGGKSVYKEAQFFLFGISFRAKVLAEELKFIVNNLPKIKLVLVGASQGAAFNNMVMIKLGGIERIYSVELGTFFAHMRRRQLTERNLAIDSNGMMRDPMCHRDLWAGTRAYIGAFYRWFKCKAQDKPVKFTNCINTPGHEYKWEYPEVQGRITEFLTANIGEKH
ncbi:MAG: hypothetical protein PHY28_03720 [Dehalococcoidales bacterium]|nr:hypothetical protein [Dehalococcoidales bacterium]